MLSISAGVMIASAIFSLLLPSIKQSKNLFNNQFVMPTLGFLIGGCFVVIADIVLDKIISNKNQKIKSKKRQFLLISAITLHNIPEGMCIGVAVYSASIGALEGVIGAVMLAVGIALQNFPEGASVALPMRSEGFSTIKSFIWGSFSGIVEPIFGILACLFASASSNLLPFLLAFSSGAMISVACTELLPESAKDNKNLTTIFLIVGFCIMMLLDLAL